MRKVIGFVLISLSIIVLVGSYLIMSFINPDKLYVVLINSKKIDNIYLNIKNDVKESILSLEGKNIIDEVISKDKYKEDLKSTLKGEDFTMQYDFYSKLKSIYKDEYKDEDLNDLSIELEKKYKERIFPKNEYLKLTNKLISLNKIKILCVIALAMIIIGILISSLHKIINVLAMSSLYCFLVFAFAFCFIKLSNVFSEFYIFSDNTTTYINIYISYCLNIVLGISILFLILFVILCICKKKKK